MLFPYFPSRFCTWVYCSVTFMDECGDATENEDHDDGELIGECQPVISLSKGKLPRDKDQSCTVIIKSP